jgi:ligand-binding sensor domain-containing protein
LNWQTPKFLLYLLLLFTISLPANSNTLDYRYQKAFKVQRLSLEQGLAASVVQDIIQDENGYIWIATEDGLSRFDSYEFKNYRHDHKNQHSLHENWLVSLAEEPGKGIWIGTVSGISFLNHRTQKFKNYSSNQSQLQVMIREIHRLNTGELYFATDTGLYFYDADSDQVIPFVSTRGKRITSSIGSIDDSEQYIYVSSEECLWRIEKATNTVFNMCDLASLDVLNDKFIFKILVDQGALWLGSNKGLFYYNTTTDKVRAYYKNDSKSQSLASNYVQDLALDDNGSLWIATTVGLNYYDRSKEVFEFFSQQDVDAEGLSAKDIAVLLLDNEGLLWLGTYGGGVNLLNPNQHKFEHILTKSDVSGLGKDNTIHGITKDKNHNLWLASYGGGLLKYDFLAGEISQPIQLSSSDLGNHVYSLFIDNQHRLWVSAYDNLTLIDLENETKINTRVFVDGEEQTIIPRVNQFTQSYTGDIYVATEVGLFLVTEVTQENSSTLIYLKSLSRELPVEITNKTMVIYSVIDDVDGNLWIGTRAGLIYYQADSQQYQHYVYDQKNPQSISSNIIQVIYQDSFGFIWIGTSDGLNRVVRSPVDEHTFYFERITTYEGLPNNSIYGILEDQLRQLWLSTNLGIVKYAKGSVTSESYRRVDGLSSDEFNTASYYSDGEGRLYFGSINGVTIINNAVSQVQEEHSRLVFTNIKVGERQLDLYAINQSEKPLIVQKSNETAIDLTVANMSFEKLNTQRYRYRIVGVNDKWNYLGTRRNIFIAGLAEGQYQVEIQTQMAGMPWSNQGKKLTIVVETDFWSSSQANYLLGMFLIAIFIVSLFLMARHYQTLVNRSRKKTLLEALRVKELRADNETLKAELAEKAKNIQLLSRRVELGEKKLDVERFRDVSTGFYRLNYFYRLEGDAFLEESTGDGKGFDCYKSIGVLELKQYPQIFQELGPLAVTELVSQVSVIIRQNLNAKIQIFQIQSGIYLIIGCEIAHQKFEDELLNIGHLIERSEFSLANGISQRTSVSQTLMNMNKVTLHSKRQLDVVIDLLIQLHQQLNLDQFPQLQRIELNELVNPKDVSKLNWRLEDLLKKKLIEISALTN